MPEIRAYSTPVMPKNLAMVRLSALTINLLRALLKQSSISELADTALSARNAPVGDEGSKAICDVAVFM